MQPTQINEVSLIIKELQAKCGNNPHDGNVLDFRNSGTQIFLIDKQGILKPDKTYKVQISLIHDNTELSEVDNTELPDMEVIESPTI